MEIIRTFKTAQLTIITSYDNFGLLAKWMGEPYRSMTNGTLLRALAYGVQAGWLKVVWEGTGLTPYAGAARRQRTWYITDKWEEETMQNTKGVEVAVNVTVSDLQQSEATALWTTVELQRFLTENAGEIETEVLNLVNNNIGQILHRLIKEKGL